MKKIWFIYIEEERLGPFTIKQLKNDPRITPDTFIWKAGMDSPVPIRALPEVANEIFRDEREKPKTLAEESFVEKIIEKTDLDEITLKLDYDPTPLIWWMILVLFICLYVTYYTFW